MKPKNQLTSEEFYLVKTIVRLVNNKFLQTGSFLEVVQISCFLNEIMYKSPNDIVSLREVEDIYKRVLINIE
jgi:hypothetical protein